MSSEDRTSDSPEDERSPEESDVTDPEPSEETTFDLHAPPSEDREASEWGGYVLAALLAVVFLVGFFRVIDPTGTGLLLGAIGTLFGLAIIVLTLRERLG